MQNHFEINVSRFIDNGMDSRWQHYFATSPRSLTDTASAWAAFDDFKKRFPTEEGFKVTMTYWECKGHGC